MSSIKPVKNYKEFDWANPVITSHYGADPFAMVYKDRVYIYATADKYEYDEKGEIKENTYSKIKSLYCISTDDFANFEDHGEIVVACDAAAKWAHNSWAPAACWKNIDGKDKFFLYFADNGGGIGVLSADSPVGPFTDPIGEGLITRKTPTCDTVEWLFDPAVIVDDDGNGYIYFGGGVPFGKAADPGTARVCKLSDDMVHLAETPVPINPPYLFEDSGIHKFNNKYYYTYCTNFSVDAEGGKKWGIENGEISMMVSDNPMGPFVFKEKILENPEKKFSVGGNNHHCVFCFKGQWYMTYHARALEKLQGVMHGYRSTHIDEFDIAEDGTIGIIKQNYKGRKQIKNVDAFSLNSAVMTAQMEGCYPVPSDEVSKKAGYGIMALSDFVEGGFIEIQGVDFKEGATEVELSMLVNNGMKVCVCVDSFDNEVAFFDTADTLKAKLTSAVSGVHNLFFVFGEGDCVIKGWKFI